MSIFAVGASYDGDVSDDFINHNIAGPGWGVTEAPELHQLTKSMKVGDFVYIKSYSPSSKYICVKAIGVIVNDEIIEHSKIVCVGRNVRWIYKTSFQISKPTEKLNVRLNTMYEEFHPKVQEEILNKIFYVLNA